MAKNKGGRGRRENKPQELNRGGAAKGPSGDAPLQPSSFVERWGVEPLHAWVFGVGGLLLLLGVPAMKDYPLAGIVMAAAGGTLLLADLVLLVAAHRRAAKSQTSSAVKKLRLPGWAIAAVFLVPMIGAGFLIARSMRPAPIVPRIDQVAVGEYEGAGIVTARMVIRNRGTRTGLQDWEMFVVRLDVTVREELNIFRVEPYDTVELSPEPPFSTFWVLPGTEAIWRKTINPIEQGGTVTGWLSGQGPITRTGLQRQGVQVIVRFKDVVGGRTYEASIVCKTSDPTDCIRSP